MSSEKYPDAENIDYLELAKYEKGYFGLAVIYKKGSGLGDHSHKEKKLRNFCTFVPKYFAKTGIELRNPPSDAHEGALDKITFKILEGVVAK